MDTIEIKVETFPSTVKLTILPSGNMVEFVNLAAYDRKSKRLIGVGGTPQGFSEQFPKTWEKDKDKIEFRKIFDVASFVPETCGNIIFNFWFNERANVQKIFRPQDYLVLNITFDGYDSLDLEKRQEFEYLLYKHTFAKKLLINGIERNWSTFKIKLAHNLLAVFILPFSVVSIVLSVIPFIKLKSTFEFGGNFDLLLQGGLFLVLICIFVYLGAILGELIWILVLLPFVPKEILRNSLLYFQLKRGKPDIVSSLLIKFFLTND